MPSFELRDPESARAYLLQGLWLQRLRRPAASSIRPTLEWALEMISADQPLPPLGFVADVGQLALGVDADARLRQEALAIAGVPSGLLRAYEDHVLGKLYADWTFARGADALRRYAPGRDQARGLVFLINQFRERAGIPGVLLAPGVVKAALELRPEDALAQGWEALERSGPLPQLLDMLEVLIASVRQSAEALAGEDLFELEHGTALQELGERLALRQALQATSYLTSSLPERRIRPAANPREVPTRMLDEDTYPVGGFASLATRGSLESLLHSQLALMEKTDRPDLFDVKFLRDELLYYARDENEFRRRRRTFAVVLFPDLIHTRFKDAVLRWQRGVLLLAMLRVVVLKLCDWLSSDALSFVLFFPAGKDDPLKPERDLLEALLREQIVNKTVEIVRYAKIAEVERECIRRARRSLCHCLAVSTDGRALHAEGTQEARLQVDGPIPALGVGDDGPMPLEAEEALESWSAAARRLLERWT